MNRYWVFITLILIIVVGIGTGIWLYMDNKEKLDNTIVENEISDFAEKVTDECTDEWEEIENEQDSLQANANQEKVSPNCLVILKKYYKKCGHLINEYIDIPGTLVNKTKEEVQKNYENWEIEEFSPTQIKLYRQYETECGEHYVLRNDDGKISIYRINELGEEELVEKTEIAIDYLTDTDKANIEEGIRVNGSEELNQLIEDFE